MGRHASNSTPQTDPELYVSQYGEREYEWTLASGTRIMVPVAEFSTGPRHAAAEAPASAHHHVAGAMLTALAAAAAITLAPVPQPQHTAGLFNPRATLDTTQVRDQRLPGNVR